MIDDLLNNISNTELCSSLFNNKIVSYVIHAGYKSGNISVFIYISLLTN